MSKSLPKSFNLAGPCVAADHYMIPASSRLGDEILELVRKKKYFLLRAPRQTGKTTLLLDLVRRINRQGDCYAMHCPLEALGRIKDPAIGIVRLIDTIRVFAHRAHLPNSDLLDRPFGLYPNALLRALSNYCESLDKPLVIFFDEADSLSGEFMLSVLSQLRMGYTDRQETPFVHSLALAGMRDLKDYKHDPNDPDYTAWNTSPFNIVSLLVLRDFTLEEVAELYGQHTAETGQPFTQEAVELAFSLTQGQPWLVNAIGDRTVNATASSPETPITGQMVSDAAQSLILSMEVHINSLEESLKEDRVQRVLEPLITEDIIENMGGDDYNYVMDLGLIRNDGNGTHFANPIYKEVILRALPLSYRKN